MNLGIDIGSIKTVIYSTKENGKIISDEFGKNEIKTVLEKTKPTRSFGNSVSGDSLNNLKMRRRYFFNDLSIEENQESLLMFLNYLNRTILLNNDYKNACLAIPEYFDQNQKNILKTLTDSSQLRVSSFLTHLTSVAACAALRSHSIPEEFMIIDCGYSKTSVGIFTFKNNILTPLKRWCIKFGGSNFDEAVYSVLIKKYNLTDSNITREMIFKEVNTIKKGLNKLESVSARIFTENYTMINIDITREEYINSLSLGELKLFFENIKNESNFNGFSEVVGNNSNNFFIQEILKDLSYSTTLNSSESASLGSCLALAVNSRKMQFKIEEILGSSIFVKIEGEEVNPTLVFSENQPLTFENVKIKYNRKANFNVEVLENNKKIGTIKILKNETESAELVGITVKISPFLVFEIVSVTLLADGSNIPYEYISESNIDITKMKELDECFTKAENDKKEMESMRNSLENLLDSFDSSVKKVFPGLITKEDLQRIDEIRDNFFAEQPLTKSIEEEKELKEKIIKSLDFINDKLKVLEEEVRKEGLEILKNVDLEISSKLTANTTALKILYGSVYSLRGFLTRLSINIENVLTFDKNLFEKLKSDIERDLKLARIEQEVSEKESKKDIKDEDKKETNDKSGTDKNENDTDKNEHMNTNKKGKSANKKKTEL